MNRIEQLRESIRDYEDAALNDPDADLIVMAADLLDELLRAWSDIERVLRAAIVVDSHWSNCTPSCHGLLRKALAPLLEDE